MMAGPYTGGIRHRLIRDSVYKYVVSYLGVLGWTSSASWHLPLSIRPSAVTAEEEVALNTLAFSDEGITEIADEIGSNLAEHTWLCYWDFYAENETIGLQVMHDIRDILAGRYPSIGAVTSDIPVLDFTQATPTQIFTVLVEKPDVQRAHGFPKDFQRSYFQLSFDLIDVY